MRVSTAERFRAAYLKDLSDGGLFIKTDKPLPIGRELVVDLLPPGFTVPLRLHAAVVRHSNDGVAGMGVKFQEVEPETGEALRKLIESYEAAAVPPNVPVDTAAEPARRLESLLEEYAILKNTLETREKDLADERARREEAAAHSLKLAGELEALKTHSTHAPSTGQIDELRAQLATKEAELAHSRMRIVEVETGLDAYRKEVQVLEEDDATSRRLAATLAQDKAGLGRELEKMTAELAKERETAQARLKDLEGRLSKSDSAAKEIIHSMQADLDARQLLVTRHDSRATALEAQLAEQAARQASFEAELKNLRSENGSLQTRITQAEAAAKDATGRLDRLKAKERELRSLLAAVSGRGEDVVVIEDARESPPAAPRFELKPTDPGTTGTIQAAAAAAAAAEPPGPPPPPPETADDVDVDLEVDPAPGTGALLPREEFENRVRANDELVMTAGFGGYQAADDAEKQVKSMLAAAGRFAELMVLVRGVLTPPQLLEVLVKLYEARAIALR